jgi:hypothetical protein
LEQQGREAHDEYIRLVKQTVFGIDYTQATEAERIKKLAGYQRVTYFLTPWNEVYERLQQEYDKACLS